MLVMVIVSWSLNLMDRYLFVPSTPKKNAGKKKSLLSIPQQQTRDVNRNRLTNSRMSSGIECNLIPSNKHFQTY